MNTKFVMIIYALCVFEFSLSAQLLYLLHRCLSKIYRFGGVGVCTDFVLSGTNYTTIMQKLVLTFVKLHVIGGFCRN